jgi:hypothetical protein
MSGKKSPKTRDVSYSAVDEITRRGVASGLTVDQASKVARESAERINKKRGG